MRSLRRGRTQLIVAAVICLSILISGCTFHASFGSNNGTNGSASGGTYADHGVSFQYPTEWHDVALTSVSAKIGQATWDKVVGPTDVDFVVVAEYQVPAPISVASATARGQVTSFAKNLFAQAHGAMTSGPTVSTMGGIPSLEYTGTVTSPTGNPLTSRVVLAFKGTSEYWVNCQYTNAHSQDILAGCDQIVSSFHTT
jgi:hypothetical protein